ncbi:MAG: hypothetical protein HY747_01590 [Elusimicrobia bacterium]|nr:hypothetical protein [Elusimicrobiota bacterium]
MKKIELIYREIIYQAMEKGQNRFMQKDLAALFNCSLSTVFHALIKPRRMGAVRVGGRFAEVTDIKKLLLYWATIRCLDKEVIYSTTTNLTVFNLEGQMPPEIVYGAFSAFRLRFKDAPADYDQVYIYAPKARTIKKRFPQSDKGTVKLTALEADRHLARYGKTTTLAQTFVDLWNMPQWYARDFANAILDKIP